MNSEQARHAAYDRHLEQQDMDEAVTEDEEAALAAENFELEWGKPSPELAAEAEAAREHLAEMRGE